ncbi:MAG: hypothetical protein PHY12_00455 [Eubacteriales bacterium]|nr:hypothetical protein [Eubacteriales bacterium]
MTVEREREASARQLRQRLINLTPIIGLVLLVALLALCSQGATLRPNNIANIIKQFVITCLASIGAVFAFASGALDMSLSGSMCLSAVSGALAGIATGSAVVMIVVTVAASMLIALVKGVVAACLNLPIFIVTIVFSSVLSAIALFVMGNETTVSIRKVLSVSADGMTVINIAFVAAFYLLALILFNYTRMGKSAKLQGGNPLASGQSGINSKKVIIGSFLMGGVGVALAALVSMMSTKTVSASTGGSVGTNIMVALVLGGMPLSGGPRSRISAALVGSLIITVLNNGLTVLGLSLDVIQLIRGAIFLVVVFITSMTYRTKLLPR